MGRTGAFVAGVLFAGSLAGQVFAKEATAHIYDALGRLTATSRSGDPKGPVQTTLGFYPADNRMSYAVADGDSNLLALPIGKASAAEGGNRMFAAIRPGATATASAVHYASANGTAVAGCDHAAGSGPAPFAAGQTIATITVPALDDVILISTGTMTAELPPQAGGAAIKTAADNSITIATTRTRCCRPKRQSHLE